MIYDACNLLFLLAQNKESDAMPRRLAVSTPTLASRPTRMSQSRYRKFSGVCSC